MVSVRGTSRESGYLEFHFHRWVVRVVHLDRDQVSGGDNERVLRGQWRCFAVCQWDGDGSGLDVGGDVYFDGRHHRGQRL